MTFKRNTLTNNESKTLTKERISKNNFFIHLILDKQTIDERNIGHYFLFDKSIVYSLIDLIKQLNNLKEIDNIETFSNFMPKDIFDRLKFVYDYRKQEFENFELDLKAKHYTNQEVRLLNEHVDYIIEWARLNNILTKVSEMEHESKSNNESYECKMSKIFTCQYLNEYINDKITLDDKLRYYYFYIDKVIVNTLVDLIKGTNNLIEDFNIDKLENFMSKDIFERTSFVYNYRNSDFEIVTLESKTIKYTNEEVRLINEHVDNIIEWAIMNGYAPKELLSNVSA